MVVIKNNVMYSCRAVMFGSDAPEAGKRGVEALQEPLKSCYTNMMAGQVVTVTVMPEFIHIDFIHGDDANFDLPIRFLSVCAALRKVDSTTGMKFIPVHSIATADTDDVINPPIFATSMRRSESEDLQCFTFRCDETRDALHLVNATQWAHTSFRQGYTATGTMKAFKDQSEEFDRTIMMSNSRTSQRIFNYAGTTESAVRSGESRTYVTSVNGRTDSTYTRQVHQNGHNGYNGYMVNGGEEETKTYYVKAGDYRPETPEVQPEQDTIYINADITRERPRTPPPQQTIIVEKPVLQRPEPIHIPKPRIIEKEVMVKLPKMPEIQQQTIYVDKPVFQPFPKWEIPQPIIKERPVYIKPPGPPKQEPTVIYVDKPVIGEYPQPPPPEPPIIKENPIMIPAPQWPKQKAQVIVVDKPVMRPMLPQPPPPEPIVKLNEVFIDPPEYQPQKPCTIVVEVPKFNKMKPPPPAPKPIIETKEIMIDPPAYEVQEPQRIVIEKPCVRDPGPPPKAPPPIIIEKLVYVDGPKYQQPEPQRIVVEKIVFRDPGPPPEPPKPIIIEKIKYIDPPPWPIQKQQTIVVEKPVIRARAPPPTPKPIIIEKPVYVDVPAPSAPPPQRVIVEKPVFTGHQTYVTRPESRSFVVRQSSPRGLRRTAYSDNGDAQANNRWEYRSDQGGYTTNARLYGQPRDFRRPENQFINERRFGTRINQEIRHTRGPADTYGGAYRINDRRRDSLSS